MKNSSTRERRDWTLLIFIIPIGIILMLIAGQVAIRLAPFWSITADMRSKLDPNSAPIRQMGLVQPIGAGILTPYDVNLTPDSDGGVIVFPPIVIFEPNGTPPISISQEPTALPATQTVPPSPTKVNTAIPTATKILTPLYTQIYPTMTKRPTNAPTSTPPKTITATTTGTPTPTRTRTATGTVTLTPTRTPTFTPTPTITLTFTQTFTPTPSFTPTETPTITPTFTQTFTPTETPTITPTPTPTSTPTPVVTDPIPPVIGTDPDGSVYLLPSGSALTLDFIIEVNGDSIWDLVYYERAAGSGIYLDWITIQIGDGLNWYTVFDWGDEMADTFTNMDFTNLTLPLPAPPPNEPDQRDISTLDLYNLTGIAIDLDNGMVPQGTYLYLRIYAPAGDADGQLEIDAIQVLP